MSLWDFITSGARNAEAIVAERKANADLLRERGLDMQLKRQEAEAAAQRILGLDPQRILNVQETQQIPEVTQDIPYSPDRPERAGLPGPTVFTPEDVRQRPMGRGGLEGLPTGGTMPEGPAANAIIDPARKDVTSRQARPSEALLNFLKAVGKGGEKYVGPFERTLDTEAKLAVAKAGRFSPVETDSGIFSFDRTTGRVGQEIGQKRYTYSNELEAARQISEREGRPFREVLGEILDAKEGGVVVPEGSELVGRRTGAPLASGRPKSAEKVGRFQFSEPDPAGNVIIKDTIKGTIQLQGVGGYSKPMTIEQVSTMEAMGKMPPGTTDRARALGPPISVGEKGRLLSPTGKRLDEPVAGADEPDMSVTSKARYEEAKRKFPNDVTKQAQWIQQQAEAFATRVYGANVTAQKQIAREDALKEPIPGGRAFNADGTAFQGTVGEAIKSGAITFKTPTEADGFRETVNSGETLKRIRDLGSKVLAEGGETKIGQQTAAAKNLLTLYGSKSPDVEALDGLMEMFSQQMAVSIQGSRPSDRDVGAIKAMTGRKWTTREAFLQRYKDMQAVLDRQRAAYMGKSVKVTEAITPKNVFQVGGIPVEEF